MVGRGREVAGTPVRYGGVGSHWWDVCQAVARVVVQCRGAGGEWRVLYTLHVLGAGEFQPVEGLQRGPEGWAVQDPG